MDATSIIWLVAAIFATAWVHQGHGQSNSSVSFQPNVTATETIIFTPSVEASSIAPNTTILGMTSADSVATSGGPTASTGSSSAILLSSMPTTAPTPTMSQSMNTTEQTVNDDDDDDLSSNTIAGIIVGVATAMTLMSLLSLIILILVVRSYIVKRKSKSRVNPSARNAGTVAHSKETKITNVKHGDATEMDSLPKSA